MLAVNMEISKSNLSWTEIILFEWTVGTELGLGIL